METVETLVIGAGVVGLAAARALAQSGREVVILEREALIGSGTSARNSEVIHAGIYYPTGSLKARVCVAGKAALYRYAAERHIPHARCGKLIVAAEGDDPARLAALKAKAAENGVDDLTLLNADEVAALEPALATTGALLSPSSGIVDSHALMLSLLGEAEEAGAMLALETPVESAVPGAAGFEVVTGGAEPMRLAAREVVNAAGHGAFAAGAAFGAPVRPEMLAKGNYFALEGAAPFSRLIYPLPEAVGLGVHATLDLQGRVKFGPDVEWVAEESYEVDPARAEGFYVSIRRYWPGLPEGSLRPDYAGIRPKLVGPGAPLPDFMIAGPESHGVPGYVGLYGIESPGLTSCLALAEEVVSRLQHTAERRCA